MTNTKYRPADALKEHMLSGNKISLIEAMLLFGVQNPNADLARLKKLGFIINSESVPMIKVITRLNRYMICVPPSNLPQREVKMTEYWISR
ncbi:MAG: hypothetical protein ACON4I_00225 [Candidatus Puniceispirillaceae bacterium]